MTSKLPVVYMDESGNKESDRFFVCGFLFVQNSEPLIKLLQEEADINITKSVTVNKPKYISIWTIDFSKTRKRSS